MKQKDLLEINWDYLSEYPKIGYPWRAHVVAQQQITNERGVAYDAKVLTNRTRKRWWLVVKNKEWLRVYLTTESQTTRDFWLSAFGER